MKLAKTATDIRADCARWRKLSHNHFYNERMASAASAIKAQIIAALSDRPIPFVDLEDGTTVTVNPDGGLWWLPRIGDGTEYRRLGWPAERHNRLKLCQAAHDKRRNGGAA